MYIFVYIYIYTCIYICIWGGVGWGFQILHLFLAPSTYNMTAPKIDVKFGGRGWVIVLLYPIFVYFIITWTSD